jgi:cysteinyl-tRNA synthetase
LALALPGCLESNPQPFPADDSFSGGGGGSEATGLKGPDRASQENRPDEAVDFRAEMRTLVGSIAAYARADNPAFVVIPQNGLELLTLDGEPDGPLADEYVATISGCGQEDLNYGYPTLGDASPAEMTERLTAFLDRLEGADREALVIDYCENEEQTDSSLAAAADHGFIAFPADRRELDDIPAYPPEPADVNGDDVTQLSEARNFLYLINAGEFESREAFLHAMAETDYDLFVVDAFFEDGPLSADEVDGLKLKANGGRRLVISYMSIGEAEDYRFYWQESWNETPPSWIAAENPDWEGNFKVRYWDPEWQAVLFGSPDSYLDRILAAGFDGIYLDIIDAFQWFEGELEK